MSFSDTDSMVPGAVEPLLDMECGGNSVKRATRPSTEGNFSVVSSLRWTEEKRYEVSGVEDTNAGIDTGD